MAGDAAFPWHLGVFDAHCHPTDTMTSLQVIPGMRAKVLTIMATRSQDQELVAQAARSMGVMREDFVDPRTDWSKEHKVVPAFGWHPWFSHQMYDETIHDGVQDLSKSQKRIHYQNVLTPKSDDIDFLDSLPDPKPFGHFLGQTRTYLERYPLALIGEVGLDKSFRIPEAWLPEHEDCRDDALTPGGREGRKLSPYRVSMDHQRRVLLAQLKLAGEMGRAVSVHGVQAHGVVYETLASTWKGHERQVASKRQRKREATAKQSNSNSEPMNDNVADSSIGSKPYPPRICLHSFSGPSDTVKQYTAPSVPCEIFFSFSTTINSWTEIGNGKTEAAVMAVPDDRIVVESDLHTAGDKMDYYLQEIVVKVCAVKGWDLEHGVRQLGENWKKFVFGSL